MDVSELRDTEIVYYVATSIDGFIGPPDGNPEWLNDYMAPELGMGAFMAAIKGTLMGRNTWDMVEAMMGGRGGGASVTVATHRPFPTKGSVSIASGSAADIAAAARARGPGPYWLMGGGNLAAQLLAAGELDRIDLFTIPVLLGSGIPAFRNDRLLALELASSGTYPKGITRHTYRPRRKA
jgi:dihydrofolate reductase